MVLILCIFYLCIFVKNGKAQDSTWSLKKCIDYALQHNIQIKQQELSTQLVKSNLTQSYASVIPNLIGSAAHTYNYGKTIDMYTNDFATNGVLSQNFYVSSSVTLFDGFQIINTIKKNKIDLNASNFELDKIKNDVTLSIASAYLQILYNEDLIVIALHQLKLTQQQVEQTKKLVEAGKLTHGNLLQMEAQAASEEFQVTEARNQLDLSILALQHLLDLEPTDNFNIEKPIIDLPSEITLNVEPSQLFSEALKNQPDIKSAELKVQSSMYGLKATQGMRSPTISLRGTLGTGYSGADKMLDEKIPFNTQFNNNINKTISFSLNVPVFNNLQAKSTIDRAKIDMLNAQYTLEIAKNQLHKNIQQAYSDSKAALNKYYASVKSVTAFKESFSYIEQKFTMGMVTTTEYNEEKNKLNKANLDLLQSKYEYVFKTKVLDFYQGKAIVIGN